MISQGAILSLKKAIVVVNSSDFIIRKIKGMQIDDFLLEKEPIDKLVSAYLEIENSYDKNVKANNQKKETVLLNSILVTLATKKSTIKQLWRETKYCLEINSGNRDCLRRGATLLIEVFKRNPQSLQYAPKDVILDIIRQSCEKAFITICGNQYIELIEHVTSKLSLSSDLEEALPSVITMVASNKLQVNTYRQETRLSLYKILLRLLNLQQEKSPLLQKCIRAGEGQKDPRNIGIVFELYLKVLQIFPTERLVEYRAAMFENIQAYYPVEFVGDEDDKQHRKVNFRQISSLLDQCLCHPFFSELTWELLSSKTAAPPLAPFISTLIAYFRSLRRTPNPTLNVRLASLLFRFSQEEFIDQEYQEHASEDLSTVVQGLLDVIFCKEDGSFTIEGLTTVKKWLDLMLSKVTIGECHHSGTMMGLFRAIINRTNTPRFAALIELVRSLSLKAILRTISDGEIIPKLGLAVVVVTEADRVSDDVQQLIRLLVLKIGSLYTTVSDEVKLLLLKILMEVYKGAERNRAMVRKVNDGLILKDILSRAQTAFDSNPNPNQAYLVKAFIDFVATVYIHEIDQLLEHVTGLNYQLEAYLLGRLWENVENNEENKSSSSKIIEKFNHIVKLINKSEQGADLVKGLRVINKPLLLKLILNVNWQRQTQFRQLIFSILLALRKELQTSNTYRLYIKLQELNNLPSKKIAQFFLHNNQEGLPMSKEEELWRALGSQEDKITFPLMSQIGTYDFQCQFMENLILAYPSTFVQWSWEQLKARQDGEIKNKRLGEILKWLPQALLLRDRKEVLGLILSDAKCAPSLLKIAKNIEIGTIKSSGIIQYCLQYAQSLLEGENPENTTERTTCILATLISVAQRDQKGDLKQAIRQGERTLKGLRQHRKRPVRQAVRRLLSLLQE